MYSVCVTIDYVNSEYLRSYLESYGFEASITDRFTGEPIDENSHQTILHTVADRFIISFIYNGEKFPPQRVFKKILMDNKDGIIKFEATFGDEQPFND